MKKIIIGAVIALVLIFVAWYLYTTLKPAEKQTEPSPFANIEIQSNPLEEKVPELNPVENANPFSGSYKNPFKK
jgi:hypothetical protein